MTSKCPSSKELDRLVLGMHLPVTSGHGNVLTPMWIAHLPLACSLQGYHGVICDNLAGSDWGMAQAGNRAGKTQPCMQTGENELEWVSVTSGNMNVLNSAFIFFGVGSANLWCDASAEWAWLDVSNMNVANPACTHCLDPTCCWWCQWVYLLKAMGWHRSYFGSRYTLSSCCKAGLFATLAKVRFQ